MLPAELQEEYEPLLRESDPEHKVLVKAADKLSAYIKCLEEENYGSKEFKIAGERLLSAVKDMNCEEANYFLDNFLEAFGLPIDSIIN